MYEMHHFESGFVAYRKNKNEQSNDADEINDKDIPVYHNQMESWRKELSIKDSDKILVAFAWYHDEDIRLCQIFAEFLACDDTFGVTKYRHNLFLLAGVDVNNEVLTCFHWYMPSKQARAYHWALRVAARYLVTDKILSLNQCITCDQEQSMYQPLREMMSNTGSCLNLSCNRLDKCHLLTRIWENNVECKVNSKYAHAILATLKNKTQIYLIILRQLKSLPCM